MEAKLYLAAVTALAGVVAYLFKLYVAQSKDSRAAEIERVTERITVGADHKRAIEKLEELHHRELDKLSHDFEQQEAEQRADFEKRSREMLERHDEARKRESDIFRAHEDQVRKEFAAMMERVADGAEKSSNAVVQLMDRMFSRFTGPR